MNFNLHPLSDPFKETNLNFTLCADTTAFELALFLRYRFFILSRYISSNKQQGTYSGKLHLILVYSPQQKWHKK